MLRATLTLYAIEHGVRTMKKRIPLRKQLTGSQPPPGHLEVSSFFKETDVDRVQRNIYSSIPGVNQLQRIKSMK